MSPDATGASGRLTALAPLTGQLTYVGLSLTRDAAWLAACATSGQVDYWRPPTAGGGKGDGPFRTFAGPPKDKPLRAVAFSPDGRRLAAAGKDCGLYVWEVPPAPGGRTVQDIAPVGVHWGHHFPPQAIGWTRDRRIVSVGEDRRVVVFKAKDGTHETLEGPKHTLNALAVHPTEHHVAVGGDDDQVWLWDIGSRPPARLVCFPVHAGRWQRFKNRVSGLAWSSDGRMLAVTGHRDPAVRLYRYPDLKPMLEFKPLATGITAVAAGPDPKLLALGAKDGSLVVVDLGRRAVVGAARLPSAVGALVWAEDRIGAACGTSQVHVFAVTGETA